MKSRRCLKGKVSKALTPPSSETHKKKCLLLIKVTQITLILTEEIVVSVKICGICVTFCFIAYVKILLFQAIYPHLYPYKIWNRL